MGAALYRYLVAVLDDAVWHVEASLLEILERECC